MNSISSKNCSLKEEMIADDIDKMEIFDNIENISQKKENLSNFSNYIKKTKLIQLKGVNLKNIDQDMINYLNAVEKYFHKIMPNKFNDYKKSKNYRLKEFQKNNIIYEIKKNEDEEKNTVNNSQKSKKLRLINEPKNKNKFIYELTDEEDINIYIIEKQDKKTKYKGNAFYENHHNNKENKCKNKVNYSYKYYINRRNYYYSNKNNNYKDKKYYAENNYKNKKNFVDTSKCQKNKIYY